MNIPCTCIVGRFICEEKNRFLCTVEVDGAQKRCYIASSCRLDNFVNLKGKTVLLTPVTNPKASTEYAVLAVRHKRSYILLNTAMANRAVENSIHSKKLSCFGKRKNVSREHKVESYKTDFYLFESKTIIEVKSVISATEDALFPTVFSERTMRQLSEIDKMLSSGYLARLVIVSLNPYVKQIRIQNNDPFYSALRKCIDRGLEIDAFTCRLGQDGNPYIDKKIPVIYPS